MLFDYQKEVIAIIDLGGGYFFLFNEMTTVTIKVSKAKMDKPN